MNSVPFKPARAHGSHLLAANDPRATNMPLAAGLTQAEREAIDAAMFMDKLQNGYAKRDERRAAELELNTPPYFMGRC